MHVAQKARFVAQQSLFGLRKYSQLAGKKTALFELHKELGGVIVDFAGWQLPVKYPADIVKEHLHCRDSASLFDVSHMGQLMLRGKRVTEFVESIVPGDITILKEQAARLTQFTNENGGIMDDCMVTRKSADALYVVVNAGCADQDIAHIKQKLEEFNAKSEDKVSLEIMDDRSLIALQGPKAVQVVERLMGVKLDTMPFMTAKDGKLGGIDAQVSRLGYTGEDGFEISVKSSDAVKLARMLLDNPEVQPAGLGSRDSLRLEAGLCLMGHDMNASITPIEAGLAWTISKRRREAGGFPGASVIQKQLKEGTDKVRIGFIGDSPAREGCGIYSGQTQIGSVTSGSFSPSLKKWIGMGYVQTPHSAVGTEVTIDVRGKFRPATISAMPFVPQRYHRVKK